MKTSVVALILDSKPEAALEVLSRWYKVSEPKLGVGVFEGRTKGVAAVYSQKRKEILAARREFLYDPFVMIHEFYHHLRSTSGHHRGTEQQADRFATEFIAAYRRTASGLRFGRED
jgi:Zn-dependent peptidase ImmA (M78 family)